MWKASCPHLSGDAVSVQGEDIRFSTHPTPRTKVVSYSLGGTGALTLPCPAPGTDEQPCVTQSPVHSVGVGVALASPAAAAITSCQRRIQGVDDTPAAPWNLRGSCVHPHHPGTLSGLLPTLNPSHERKQALLYLGLWGHQTTLLAHRQALQVDYSFSCLLLASFNGSTFSCTLPRENEFTWPIFSHRDLSPFGIQVS